MRSSYEAIVVGLGAMGGSICYHLARRGIRVLGIDRFNPPHSRGSSHGESRIIREAYFEHPSYVPLVRRARELWHELEDDVRGVLFHRTGALLVGDPISDVISGAETSARLHGIAVERLAHEEIARRFPMFRASAGTVGVYEPGAGVLDAEGCVAAHLVAAEERGATLLTDETVQGWRQVGGALEVTTATERFTTERLILAAGPWMPQLVPELRLTLERQVMHWFEPRYSERSMAPEHCPVFLFDTTAGTYYGVPNFGSGVKVARHHGGSKGMSVEEIAQEVGEDDVACVADFLQAHVPPANGLLLRSVLCRYTNTASGHFVIDQHPSESGIWVVSACSGHGFKFASVIGEVTADLVLEGAAGPDVDLFRIATPGQPN